LSACQAVVRVNVDVSAGGSGTVSVTLDLDRSAAQAVGPLQLSDLEQAGWRVAGPRPTPGGGLTVTASKPFRSPAEAEQIIAEISGSNGPFHDLHLSRRQSLLGSRTTITARGTVDLTCGVQCFTDPALQQQLGAAGGSGLSLPPDTRVAFHLTFHLPGKSASWQGGLGERSTLVATGRTWDTGRLLGGGVLVALMVAGLVVIVVIVAGRRPHAPRHVRRR
jgi:hypothetical protein